MHFSNMLLSIGSFHSQGQNSYYINKTKEEKTGEQCLPSSRMDDRLYLLHKNIQSPTRCPIVFL